MTVVRCFFTLLHMNILYFFQCGSRAYGAFNCNFKSIFKNLFYLLKIILNIRPSIKSIIVSYLPVCYSDLSNLFSFCNAFVCR